MENDAADQLALVADARARVADAVVTPWWYTVSLGALMSALVLAMGLGLGSWWYALVVALVLFGEGMVIGAYRRVVGVWATTWDGIPRWTVWVGLGVGLLLLAAAAAVKLWTSLVWPVWGLAAAMFVGIVVWGRWTDLSWRARMRESA